MTVPRKRRAVKRKPKKGDGPRPAHRPTLYDPAFVALARDLVRREHWTNRKIAEHFGVADRTLRDWRARYPAFNRAFKRTDEERVEVAEGALFDAATGYSHEATKVFQYQGKVVHAKYEEVFPPDVGALKLFLQAKKPEQYRDRLDVGGDPKRPVRFIIEGLDDPKPAESAKPEQAER